MDDDAIVLAEIVEFALSLAPLSKGQEPFHGLPHLQPYKLVRAVSLAEMGHVLAANRSVSPSIVCKERLNRAQVLRGHHCMSKSSLYGIAFGDSRTGEGTQ